MYSAGRGPVEAPALRHGGGETVHVADDGIGLCWAFCVRIIIRCLFSSRI